MCKFLAQYQQLWTPRVGDKIRVLRPLDHYLQDIPENTLWYYRKGDIGVIEMIDVDTTQEIIDFFMVKINGSLVGMIKEEFEYCNE